MDNYAYVTAINDERYLPGVLSLYEKIKHYCLKPLYVLISNDLPSYVAELFDEIELKYIVKENYCISFGNDEMSYWGKTLFKLRAFECRNFSKIVLIDCDMLIKGSLDSLFEKDDFSAVPDRRMLCDGTGSFGFNSGLLVIEPCKHNVVSILNCIKGINRKIYGDQDILNAYYKNWGESTLELSNVYNIFAFRVEKCDDAENARIIHYIGPVKPWEWNRYKYSFVLIKLVLRMKWKSAASLREYRASVMRWKKYIRMMKKGDLL